MQRSNKGQNDGRRGDGAPSKSRAKDGSERNAVSLKELARRLELSPTTLSLVLNDSPVAESIPEKTKRRIWEAARGLNYRPNYVARSLRNQRTFTVGVMIPELSDGYASLVLSGIEDYLLRKHYMFLVASHGHRAESLEKQPHSLYQRCVEGLIAVDTPLNSPLALPVVCVSGHQQEHGFTNIVLNHDKAAELALGHLFELGHRDIAFIKGQEFSSDTAERWKAIQKACRLLGIAISPRLVTQLEGAEPSPEIGYLAARKLLAAGVPFSALFAFNDVSATGAIRAIQESGYVVPRQISVVGFDDVQWARYYTPALTTIRQPLFQMGALAAERMVQRIEKSVVLEGTESIFVDPELIVRESTCPAPSQLPRTSK